MSDDMVTEYLVVIEGVKYGRPFRESSRAFGEADAERVMGNFRDRIDNPPKDGLGSHHATILRAELRTRQVTPWGTVSEVGHRPIVDTWLSGDRHRLHDMQDVEEMGGVRI